MQLWKVLNVLRCSPKNPKNRPVVGTAARGIQVFFSNGHEWVPQHLHLHESSKWGVKFEGLRVDTQTNPLDTKKMDGDY